MYKITMKIKISNVRMDFNKLNEKSKFSTFHSFNFQTKNHFVRLFAICFRIFDCTSNGNAFNIAPAHDKQYDFK